jgi:signal transduction histidine kinase
VDIPGVIAVLTPTARDADVAERVLARVGLSTTACDDMHAVCALIHTGDVGAVLIAEEALAAGALSLLLDTLDAQPPWSDVPLVVLTGEDELSHAIPGVLGRLTERANVTLLERPVRVATIVTVLRAALRARERQWDVRDHLEERRELLDRERAAREEAEAANRAKSDFLATMSHELRTPLNAIGGYAQLIELGVRGPITPEQLEDLRRIERSQRHLLSLINDVLNFAKLEAGRVEIEVSTVRVRDLLLGVEALVMPQLQVNGLRYVREDDGDSLAVRADEEKSRQVLVNLFSNAVKFTPAGGEIRVTCAADAACVSITVSDTGHGIPADRLEAIFEPFVQIGRGLTSRQEGTGLGLAISRDLARRMGGDVTVRSVEGEGASFRFTLPRAD